MRSIRLPLAAAAALLLGGPALAQSNDVQNLLDQAGRALGQAGETLRQGYQDSAKAIDQAIANPQDPTYGSLATRLIRSEVLDSAQRPIAEIADFVIAPNGQVLLAIIRIGGTLGMGGRLVAADYAQLEPVLVKGHQAFIYRGDLGALPDYKVASGG
ncbi:PRC-barrel domain-containing protein [Inquilinus limosus]|uniref:PRC-barrel domain-containing protein n=1 Tax=Inquilinus limosus TaxID=171674 RepID=UPI0004290EA9|nr:PRC-barrel domain-containing protein [Inquilinus limosus]